ncbi:hypothetical protein LPJ56_007024, partial [Coemansia sp. RSA 2599]
LNRARKLLLDRHFPSVTIHGMGAAVQQAVMLANALKASLADQVILDVASDTVTLYDDVVPDDPNADIVTQKRQTSAIHIKVALKDDLQKAFGAKRRR